MEFISVKDRLPEPNIEVKIKWKDGSESYAYLCSVCKNEFMDSITGSPLADFPIMMVTGKMVNSLEVFGYLVSGTMVYLILITHLLIG